jgi:MFS transporter, AAHS family, 4-hydroxybenzoate transporter
MALSGTLLTRVEALIDGAPTGSAQYRLLFFCFLIAIVDGFDLAAMALAAPLIANDWRIANTEFGLVLSASLAGLGIGGGFLAPFGDRIGRRPMIMLSFVVVGLGSFLTPLSETMKELVFCRFLTGIGLGIAMPNIYALVSDVMPKRRRIAAVTILACAVSAGGLFAGAVAGPVSDRWGWQAVFVLGGTLPVILLALSIWFLVESPKFLAEQPQRGEKFAKSLRRLGFDIAKLPHIAGARATPPASALAVIRPPYLILTLAYSFICTANAFAFYMLANWLPSMLMNAGIATATAMESLSFVYGGAIVGGLFFSWAMDRLNLLFALVAVSVFASAALLLAVMGQIDASAMASPSVLLALGATVGGAQYMCPGLGARIFPASSLASALGWIGAISRIGAVLGPLAGGWMLSSGWDIGTSLSILALPASLCAIASLILLPRRRNGTPQRGYRR